MSFVHFIRYLLATVFLFLIYSLIKTNSTALVSLDFSLPLIGTIHTTTSSLISLLIFSFLSGFVFAALVGALRLSDVYRMKKEIKTKNAAIIS